MGRTGRTKPHGRRYDFARASLGVELLIGGGISNARDLRLLDLRGAWGALVGSALHDGGSPPTTSARGEIRTPETRENL